MMKPRFQALWAVAAAFSVSTAVAQETPLRSLAVDPATGFAAAVRVDDRALAHTSQLLPVDAAGNVAAAGDAAAQTRALLQQLSKTLAAAGSGTGDLVKLNVYVANDDVAATVREALRENLGEEVHPAVSFVSGALAKAGALVALDAVAALSGAGPKSVQHHLLSKGGEARPADVSILPRGGVVYISGQAEPGDDLAQCTRKTLASLQQTLEFLGLRRENVVQLKSFLDPMSEAAVVDQEIAAHFAGGPIPSHVPVEWTTAGRIEIELIASLPSSAATKFTDQLSFPTPPDMTTSPVFSRVAVVTRGPRLYVSGLYGAEAEEQVPDIFAQLKTLLQQTGSDFDHLAKATYYVANDDVSRRLNEYRPTVYNPQRPPAASKAPVRGVGQPDRTITLDMIAVIPE